MSSLLAFPLLVLPWLNPFAGGASSAVTPWLVSAFCAVTVWVLYQFERVGAIRSGCWVRRIAASWLAAALLSSAIALVQYFGLGGSLAPWVSPTAAGEAYANLRQRNQLASLTAIGVAALLWWAPRIRRGPAMAAMFLLAAANAASASRTGLVELLMLALLVAVWPGADRRLRLELCLAGLLAYVLAAIVLPLSLEAFTGLAPDTVWGRISRGEGCSSRVVLWSDVVHLIGLKPWQGWGWGELDYAHYFTLYPMARFCDILDNAHNLPLHLAVELGLPAAAMLVGLFVWWVCREKPWRESDPTRQMAWSVVATILLHSMLEYPLWYGPFQIAFVLSLGLLRRRPATSERAVTFRPWAAAGQALLTLGLFGALGYAAWDYHRVSQIYLPPEARDAAYRVDPLSHIRGSVLFRSQVRFAELTTSPLTRDNAQWTFDNSLALLHFSPEPRVIEKVIESATLLGRYDVAQAHLARFQAAFPEAHARWKDNNLGPPPSAAASP